jgi:uncharacterized RDD family membrane protein YckC
MTKRTILISKLVIMYVFLLCRRHCLPTENDFFFAAEFSSREKRYGCIFMLTLWVHVRASGLQFLHQEDSCQARSLHKM